MYKYLTSFGIHCMHIAFFFVSPLLLKGQITPPDFKDKVIIKENYKIPGEIFPARGSVLIIKGNAYVGGDIFVGDSAYIERFQFMQASSVSNREASIWPGGIIPYEIDYTFSATERRRIIDAMNHIMDRTNVKFVLRNDQTDFIRFRRYTVAQLGFLGGSAPLGRNPGMGLHEIKLSQFDMPLIAHEILHVLGIMHEHTRNDRDNFINVLTNNIPTSFRSFFEKFPRNDTRDIGAYDFNSIMHYNATAFGIVENGVQRQTIENKSNTKDLTFGKAVQLSTGDITGVNTLYPTSAGNRVIPYTEELITNELAVGQTKTVTVQANIAHNFVNVFMRSGQKFEIRVTPTTQRWKGSLFVESTATGFTRGATDFPRQSANMMRLMGELFRRNNDIGTFIEGSGFSIGTSRDYTASINGYLILYGNDNIAAYVDNSGSLTVTIKRVL